MRLRSKKSVVASGYDANAVAVGVSGEWPSLADELALAGRLFGSSGASKVDRWVNEQAELVGDVEFARTFSDHLALPGVASPDYAHRHVRTARGDLLGGIRFYSRNTARPFVDVLAHSFDDIGALTSCVVAEWSNFNVRFLRMRTTPYLLAERPDVILDKSIHLARCRDMAPADGRITLDRFDTAEDAIRLVAERYAHVAETDPGLSNNLTAAQPDDLRDWHEYEQMWAIRTGDDTVGVFAVAPCARLDHRPGDQRGGHQRGTRRQAPCRVHPMRMGARLGCRRRGPTDRNHRPPQPRLPSHRSTCWPAPRTRRHLHRRLAGR